MPTIYITFLNRLDIEELALTNDEILAAIETSLGAQGRGQAVIEPRVHLAPGQSNGHFNVLRGAINAPVDRAGVKVVGDFLDNYKLGSLPSSASCCCSIRATARRRRSSMARASPTCAPSRHTRRRGHPSCGPQGSRPSGRAMTPPSP